MVFVSLFAESVRLITIDVPLQTEQVIETAVKPSISEGKPMSFPDENPVKNGAEVEPTRALKSLFTFRITTGNEAFEDVATRSWLSVVSSAISPRVETTGALPVGIFNSPDIETPVVEA
jgi:hypothetical protein